MYELASDPSMVVKVYHKTPLDEEHVAKLRTMTAVWSPDLERIAALAHLGILRLHIYGHPLVPTNGKRARRHSLMLQEVDFVRQANADQRAAWTLRAVD